MIPTESQQCRSRGGITQSEVLTVLALELTVLAPGMVEYALELILLALVLTVLLLITVVANAHHSIGYVESSNLPVYFIRFCCVKQL